MKNILILISGITALSIAGCNSGGGSSTQYPVVPTNLVGPNDSYKCLPSGYPGYSVNNGLKIAYGSRCRVSDLSVSNPIRPSLESMAIALSYNGGGRYCTGTPLSSYESNGVVYGYVLSAAHCVFGGSKSAGESIGINNIKTFRYGMNYVNQTTDAYSGSGHTGEITAVYVPQQYCKNSATTYNATAGDFVCSNLVNQDGDIALLKVKYNAGVKLSKAVELANSNLSLPYPNYIMALGYGITNTNEYNTDLFYITYEYFGTNSYQGFYGGANTLMNGYSINNAFYSIICGGDSGGGDFYWDGSKWRLIGVHSYGSTACGAASYSYGGAFDVSADVRPFVTKLNNVINNTSSGDDCNNTVASANGFICRDKTN